jgi:hypothetical protein
MAPEIKAILDRASNGVGGFVWLKNVNESRHFIEANRLGLITPYYDHSTTPPKYLGHVWTPAGEEAWRANR